MIHIDLDLGNVPSVLAKFSDPTLLDRVTYAAAERYNDDIHDWIGGGRSFMGHTGLLQQSINWRPGGHAAAEVFAQADYAGYVEDGTRPHAIDPKPGRQALKIPVANGGYLIRRHVDHPGSQPYPYFFADLAGRQDRLQAQALSVMARFAGVEHG